MKKEKLIWKLIALFAFAIVIAGITQLPEERTTIKKNTLVLCYDEQQNIINGLTCTETRTIMSQEEQTITLIIMSSFMLLVISAIQGFSKK